MIWSPTCLVTKSWGYIQVYLLEYVAQRSFFKVEMEYFCFIVLYLLQTAFLKSKYVFLALSWHGCV